MIKERLIELFNEERTSVWFEKQTGIDRYRWGNIRSGKVRVSSEDIDAVVSLFPNWAFWLTTGNIAPEIGQTSPAYDLANEKLQEPNAG